jgi:hypothetical protein
MSHIKYLMVFAIVSCALMSCSRKDDAKAKADLIGKAEEINKVFSQSHTLIDQLRSGIEPILAHPGKYGEPLHPESRYRMFKGKMYYSYADDGGGVICASGFVPVDSVLKNRIGLLEHLQPLIKKTAQSSQLLGGVYLTTRDSIDVAFPYYDATTYLEPGQDFTKDFVTYREAVAEKNPDRKTLWVSPYIDAVGNGYMISVISPVYVGNTLEGVLGGDITMEDINNEFLKSHKEAYLILSDDSLLIALNEPCKGVLGLEGMEKYYYLKGMAVNEASSDKFRLSHHESDDIKTFAQKAVSEEEFEFTLGKRNLRALVSSIPEVKWHLVRILEP